MFSSGGNESGNLIGMANKFLAKRKVKDTSNRRIFVNLPLPNDMLNPKTGLPKTQYPRNKIRTTKYTPLTFIPKNLLFQFSNIANIYFLFVIVLGAWSIFGVQNPAMQAVPLIVVVCLTAIKDGFEDERRASSDYQLNASRVHIISGITNPNVIEDNVGPWRRLKKLCTKIMRKTMQLFKKKKYRKTVDLVEEDVPDLDSLITSTVTRTSHPRLSMASQRRSLASRPDAKISKFHPNTVSNPNVQPQMNYKFRNSFWKNVNVGDIIRVRNNEEVPSDAVILSTSDPDGNCYIETKNLDGETNLKNRNALHCGQGLKHACDFERVQMEIETEAPNVMLYKFRGVVNYTSYSDEKDTIGEQASEPISQDNVLLRGTTLRNTKWVLCVVVATGTDTKIMLNSGVTPTKKSKISTQLNLSILFNFFILFVLCFVSGLINGIFYNKNGNSFKAFEYKPYAGWSAAANGAISFFAALILYQTLVPISFYVSIEIIRTIQAIFIFADAKMYYPKLDFSCTPKSWNISDDLGQIEYIFSDKTGTLTQNVMEFKKCTVAGKQYGMTYTEAQQGMDKRTGVDVVEKTEKMNALIHDDRVEMCKQLVALDNDQFRQDRLTFVSSDYVKDSLQDSDPERKKANENFMLALALCHTVITEKDSHGYLEFKAESPDEAALVQVARDLGIVFRERTSKGQVITMHDSNAPQLYEMLDIIPFNSTRKRMSIILRTPDGRILLLCKGADNIIYERLDSKSDENMLSQTAIHLGEFAQEGLRTLCIASKEVDPSFFEDWHGRYKEASGSVSDDREAQLELIGEEIEKDLTLLGGTAIEDKLQDGVPESISTLRKAGIKLWVLTGDKVETAINIGFSCNLLDSSMKLLIIQSTQDDAENNDSAKVLVEKFLSEKFGMTGSEEEIEKAKRDHSIPTSNNAIIIDGVSLASIFKDKDLTLKFLLLCKQCKSVLCCRVTPAQKADVVKMVKNTLGVMTLAIGDGANDVSMIQCANVGVGIAGEEGRQAVMSSDYAIAQFRFLTRLLLVHGKWDYKRLSEMVPCFFYKNANFVMVLFFYGIFCNFDGTYLYEFTYLMCFNLFFTSVPVIMLAIMDQDVSDVVSLAVPQLYRTGVLGIEWSQYKFFYYMLDGLYQSAVAFFFPYLIFYKGGFASMKGLQLDHRFWIGTYAAHISIFAANIYILLRQFCWDWLSVLLVILSNVIVFLWTGAWTSSLISDNYYKAASQCYGSATFWVCLFIGILASLLPRFVYDVLRRLYSPSDANIIQEMVSKGQFDNYPADYDPTNPAHSKQIILKSADHATSSSSDESLKGASGDLEKHTSKGPLSFAKKLNALSVKRRKTLKKKSRLEQLKDDMVQRGESSPAASLQVRASTEGLVSNPEHLMKIHTRNSALNQL